MNPRPRTSPRSTARERASAGSDAPHDLVWHLRAATRAEHEATEAALGLLAQPMTMATYRGVLLRFHGYYVALDRALSAAPWLAAHGLAWRPRAPIVRRDLEATGAPVGDLAACPVAPALEGPAAELGCRYVLEGAALGGQVIARHAMAALPITAEHGCTFFAGDAATTPVRWQAFLATLRTLGEVHRRAQPEAISAAVATFRTLRQWWETTPR